MSKLNTVEQNNAIRDALGLGYNKVVIIDATNCPKCGEPHTDAVSCDIEDEVHECEMCGDDLLVADAHIVDDQVVCAACKEGHDDLASVVDDAEALVVGSVERLVVNGLALNVGNEATIIELAGRSAHGELLVADIKSGRKFIVRVFETNC